MSSKQDIGGRESKYRHSRRTALKAIGAGAIGFSGIIPGLTTARAGHGTVEIITHMSGEEIHRKEEVSKKWHDDMERARNLRYRLDKQFAGASNVDSVAITSLEERIGDLRSHAVKVFTTKQDTPSPSSEAEIPDEVDGIPVLTEEISSRRSMDCYDSKTDNLKGGNKMLYQSSSGDWYKATLFCRGYQNGSKYMLACRHLFVESDNKDSNCVNQDVTGRKWYQGDNNNPVGKVVRAYQNHDLTVLDTSLDSNRTITNKLVLEPNEIYGRVTNDGLDYMMSNDITVTKRGTTSCGVTGDITNYGSILGCFNGNYIGNVVNTDCFISPGDSGGPMYHTWDEFDRHYMVGIATHEVNGDNETNGSSAQSMYAKRGITFGGNPYSGGCCH